VRRQIGGDAELAGKIDRMVNPDVGN